MNALQNAVLEQLGYGELNDECKEALQDVATHGAQGGFSGFIYYSDTTEFFDNNKREILEQLNSNAEEFGFSSTIEFVKSFNCLNGDYNDDEIGEVLYSPNSDDAHIKNALAWYALESVAYELSNA